MHQQPGRRATVSGSSVALGLRPEILALLAAMANGTIGPFSRIAFEAGAGHAEIAFFKCFGAFIIVASICLPFARYRRGLIELRHKALPLCVLSATGIAGVYFLETWAYRSVSIPLVSLLIYAAGGLVLPISALFLGERFGMRQIMIFALILLGAVLLYAAADLTANALSGVLLALLGGLAYAIFIVGAKAWKVGSGLAHLVWMFGFSSLILFIPWWIEGAALPGPVATLAILGQILVPAIGGYWLTMAAVHKGKSTSSVQVIETSEPAFACLYAFLMFGDRLTSLGILGAVFVLLGLILSVVRRNRRIAAAPALVSEGSW
jgi:drug/metabolite transporter, DME family